MIEAKDTQKRIDEQHLFSNIYKPKPTLQDKKVKTKYGSTFLQNLRSINDKNPNKRR
jgi:hypothetical protein